MEFPAALFLAQKAEKGCFKNFILGELQSLDKVVIVNLLSCFLFVEEMIPNRVSLITLLKDQLPSTSNFDFYNDVLQKFSFQNEVEVMDLCREFVDMILPLADVRMGVNQIDRARLTLKQIKELECSSDFDLPLDIIEVESLVIIMTECKVNAPIPDIRCKRVIFKFYNNANELRKRFLQIIEALQKNNRKRMQPFPEIWLDMYGLLPDNTEYLSSLNIAFHSVQLDIESKSLTSESLRYLLDKIDINSELILNIKNESDCIDDFLFFKTIVGKVNYKITINIECCTISLDQLFTLELPMTIKVKNNDDLKNSANSKLVEKLIISAEKIDQCGDFSLWPNLRSLCFTNRFGSNILSNLLDVIKEKAPQLEHIIINSSGDSYPDVVVSVPTQEKENVVSRLKCVPPDLIVHEITIVNIYLPFVSSYLSEELKKRLRCKQILRLYVMQEKSSKYEIQKSFPSSEFEIDCVYRRSCVGHSNWTNLQYLIKPLSSLK